MIYAIIAVLVLIGDQWLKYWVTANITLETGSQPIIDGVIKLVNIHNNGAAFGLLDNVPFARWIFIGLAAALCVVIIILIAKRTFPGKFPTWCMVLFMAGAVGNCIDRGIYGYVVDMFKLEFMSFAVFNVADIFLTVSCFLFIIYLFVGGKDEEAEAAAIEAARMNKKSVAAEEVAEPAEKKEKRSRRAEKTEEEVKMPGVRRIADTNTVSDNDDAAWNSLREDLRRPAADSTVVAAPKETPAVARILTPEVSIEPTIQKPAPVKEEKKSELSELIPELGDLNLDDIATGDTSASGISVEDILREFGL